MEAREAIHVWIGSTQESRRCFILVSQSTRVIDEGVIFKAH